MITYNKKIHLDMSGFANDKKEEEKNGRYSMFTPAFKKEFAPFAVESTGRIGKAAHQLLDTLAESQICSPFLVNILKRDISLEMLKFRANLVISNRMSCRLRRCIADWYQEIFFLLLQNTL